MNDAVRHVLFLCTGNSARSIIAEALLNAAGKGRFQAHSAGSRPTGAVNAHALAALRELGVPAPGARSKSWEEFAAVDSPAMDFVITVCDNAAGEVCPVWPGRPANAHWGLPDPAAVTGSDEDIRRAFLATATTLKRRIDLLLALPPSALDRSALGREVRDIGSR